MLINKIQQTIAKIDKNINNQLCSIYKDETLSSLISIWTGLVFLTSTSSIHNNIRIRLLDISQTEIQKDVNAGLEVDDSSLFTKIYEQELGIAGGEPFNIILGNYYFELDNHNHIQTLSKLAEISANAFTLFVSNNKLPKAEKQTNIHVTLKNLFGNKTPSPWRRLRDMPFAKFLVLTLCDLRIKATSYYEPYNQCLKDIILSSATILTTRIMQSFAATSWFSELPGEIEIQHQDIVASLSPCLSFPICVTSNFYFQHDTEQLLLTNGITPILQNNQNSPIQILSTTSVQRNDSSVSLILEHILCACRIAHHIKILARQKIGSLANEQDCEISIHQWLQRYTANINDQSLRFRYPLKDFNVKLAKIPGKVGVYSCQILLEPHMRLESMNSKILLHSEIISTNT